MTALTTKPLNTHALIALFGARVMIDAIAGNWEGTPPVA